MFVAVVKWLYFDIHLGQLTIIHKHPNGCEHNQIENIRGTPNALKGNQTNCPHQVVCDLYIECACAIFTPQCAKCWPFHRLKARDHLSFIINVLIFRCTHLDMLRYVEICWCTCQGNHLNNHFSGKEQQKLTHTQHGT